MGGHLFSKYNTPRLPRSVALEFQCAISEKIEAANILAYPIPAYKEKEDFGDLDFLYVTNPNQNTTIEQIASAVGALEFQVTGNSWSFLCHLEKDKYIQIDLMRCLPEQKEFFFGYYAYNDFGSLVGRVSRAAGLKFSDTGLYYEYRHKDIRSYIFLTRDWKKALKLLDIDHDTWARGFRNVDEIYPLLKASKYFDKEKFVTATLNHDRRRRATQRPGWIRFIELVNSDPIPSPPPPPIEVTKALLFQEFSFLEKEIKTLSANFQTAAEVKKRFNGNFVATITGLQDKELGQFMAAYRSEWPSKEAFSEAILSLSLEDLESSITAFHERYSQETPTISPSISFKLK